MDKKTALDKLNTAYLRSETVKNSHAQAADFLEWKNFAQAVINSIYGENSKYALDFAAIKFDAGQVAYRVTPAHKIHAFATGLQTARELLFKLSREIAIHGDKILGERRELQPPFPIQAPPPSNEVIIIHGKNSIIKEELIVLLEKLHLKPFILNSDEGGSAIAQIDAKSNALYAIGIITPDEIDLSEDGQEVVKLHPSQLVVFEFGYAAGKLGKNKSACLYRHGVELPFENAGIPQIQIDRETWKFRLVREMKAAGLNVDANQLI